MTERETAILRALDPVRARTAAEIAEIVGCSMRQVAYVLSCRGWTWPTDDERHLCEVVRHGPRQTYCLTPFGEAIRKARGAS